MPKGRVNRDANTYFDLDTDVPEVEENDEEFRVLNNRKRSRSGREGEVLPGDAHKSKEFEGENTIEEEKIALKASKLIRKAERDSDFGLSAEFDVDRFEKRPSQALSSGIEVVEREFDSLSTDERLNLLSRDSPEVEKLLLELKNHLEEARKISEPLRKLLHERKVSVKDKHLVAFLETKVQLMISYCMHIMFYLLLKLEGKQVKGHPVLGRLIELRVYFEKIHPLQMKLQYSLNRLLSGATAEKANAPALRPVRESDSGLFDPQKRPVATNREARQQEEARREAEELEKEELSAMTRVQQKRKNKKVDLSAATPLYDGYHEDGDQFFQQLVDDDNDDDQPIPLIERLRGKKILTSRKAPSEREDSLDAESEASEDANYEELVKQEKVRETKSKMNVSETPRPFQPKEVERRQIGKKIESHRGLTKSRPKDRKTPRTSQRRKYERGLQVAKAQTRSAAAEPSGGFVGSTTLKSNVVHSTKF